MSRTNRRPRVHPGEQLREEFLPDFGITAYRLAKEINVAESTISRLLAEKSRVTPALAIKLGMFFDTSAEMWMNMQAIYDLQVEREKPHEINHTAAQLATA